MDSVHNPDVECEEMQQMKSWAENSIWVTLDFPRFCLETLISKTDRENSLMFSCLMENARRKLEEAIPGSCCKKPCCKDYKKEWDSLGFEGLEEIPSESSSSSFFGNWVVDVEQKQSSTSPHEGLFYVLPFLMLKDLLSIEQVCKSLKDAVCGDMILWKHIRIDHSLNTKLTDDVLLKLAARTEGRLETLALIDCLRISDEAVEKVVAANPMLSRIFLPGCIRISVDAVVRMVEHGKSRGFPGIKQVKIRGVSGVTKENLSRLQSLLGVDEEKQRRRNTKPHYYICGDATAAFDERAIDVESCPRCGQPRAVYDCTREKCKTRENPPCKGCIFCIPRCEDCGMCIDDTDYEETFCLRLLCSECWLRLPKCLECNRPGCESSSEYFIRRPDAMFVCPDCQGAYNKTGAGLEFYVI